MKLQEEQQPSDAPIEANRRTGPWPGLFVVGGRA